jgi:hypothetical protein
MFDMQGDGHFKKVQQLPVPVLSVSDPNSLYVDLDPGKTLTIFSKDKKNVTGTFFQQQLYKYNDFVISLLELTVSVH